MITKLDINQYVDQKLNLLNQYFSYAETLSQLLHDNSYENLTIIMEKRQHTLSDLLKLDSEAKKQSFSLSKTSIHSLEELAGQIRLSESELVKNLSLKIQKLDTDHQEKAKGLETLKGYRNTYFSEKKQTIGII